LKGIILFILLFILPGLFRFLDAQIKPGYHFTEDDGLAGNMVRDIIKDKNGFLWIATDNGISRFDGDKFQNIYKTNGLPSNKVWALTVDETNTIYAGCFQGGLAIIRNDSVKQVVHLKSKYPDSFRKLYFSDFYRKVIVGTEDGIYLLKDSLLLPIDYKRDITSKSIILSITGQGEKLFFTVLKGDLTGLFQLFINDKYPDKSYATRISEKGRFASMVMNDTLYSGDYNNISKQSINNLPKQIPNTKIDSSIWIWSMSPYKNNKYLLGGLGDGRFKGDIILFDTKNNNSHSLAITKNTQTVYSILFDSTSNVSWFCRDNGLTAHFESPFESIDYTNNGTILDIGLAGDSLMVLTEDNIYLVKDNHLIPTTTKQLATKRLTSEWNSKNSRLGLKFRKLFDSSRGCEFASFTQDGGKLYVNTALGAISVPDLKTYLPFAVGTFKVMNKSAYSIINYLPLRYYPSFKDSIGYVIPKGGKGSINDISEIIESKGIYYFQSNYNGLYAIKEDRVFRLDENNSKIDNSLTDIDKDADGNIWCCSANGNLFEIGFRDSLFVKRTLVLSKCNLIGNNCKWLKFNGNYLFIGTNKGLNVISKKNLYSEKPSIEHFYNSFNGYDFVSAVSPITDSKGNLYVHTLHQIVKIDTIFNHNAFLKLNFSGIFLNGIKEDITNINRKTLSYSKRQIAFIFNAIKYPFNKNTEYRYKINNGDWIPDNHVVLQSLRSGKYDIVLEAFDKENMARHSETITFIIQTPFWQTVWFLLLLGILLIVGVFLMMTIRIEWLKSRYEKDNRLIIFNSELILRSLQLQMNPHFIFNALQTVQAFILRKNVEEGLVYVGNLAGLIRSNLENATEEYIHLSSEIEFLKKYVEIEKIRFKNQLVIEFISQIDDSNVLLPPMLIQPIIENAIKHGIRSGEKAGTIIIEFKRSDKVLIISIEDNGVGREFTKRQKKSEHANKGLEIIRQRLKLLNSKYNNDLHHIDFVDLYADELPSGTRVVLQLMLKQA
jgi:sensor histidine kinase YesM